MAEDLYKAVIQLISAIGSLVTFVALALHWINTPDHAAGISITLWVGVSFVFLASGLRGLGWLARKL